jgi:hypothetical protein
MMNKSDAVEFTSSKEFIQASQVMRPLPPLEQLVILTNSSLAVWCNCCVLPQRTTPSRHPNSPAPLKPKGRKTSATARVGRRASSKPAAPAAEVEVHSSGPSF